MRRSGKSLSCIVFSDLVLCAVTVLLVSVGVWLLLGGGTGIFGVRKEGCVVSVDVSMSVL